MELLEKSRTDPLYPAIMLASGLGLRRSEALGIRWSRIDWEQRTVLLDTKIVESDEVGGSPIPIEEMKNKSSRRTLPLPDPVYEMLLNEKEKQAVYKKMFKSSYSNEFEDYVCVNQLGELMKPSYVTQYFSDLLKRLGMRHIRFHDLRHPYVKYTTKNNCDNLMKIFACTEPVIKKCAKSTQSQFCCRGKRTPALSASLQWNL